MAFVVLCVLICILRWSGSGLWGIETFTSEEKIQMGNCRYLTGTVAQRWTSGSGYTYILENCTVYCENDYRTVKRMRVSETEYRLDPGSVIKASGKISFYEHETNPGGFDKKTYYEAAGISACFSFRKVEMTGTVKKYVFARWSAALRERLADCFQNTMGTENGVILSAMLTGERGNMDDEIRISYTVSGLGHLLAISGLHVGIVGMAVLRILMLFRVKRAAASVISSGFLFAYCLFSGAHDSTLRAFIMFAVMAGARCLLRSYDMPSSLCFAGILLLLQRPQRLFTAGFLLSFAAAGGLAVIYPLIKRLIPEIKDPGRICGRICQYLRDGFLVWLSVNLATIPIMMYFYCEFAVYSAAANMLFVPMTSAVILLGAAGGLISLLFPAAGRLILIVPSMLISVQDGAGKFIRTLPCNVYICGRPDITRIFFYCFGLLIFLLWLRRRAEYDKMKNCGISVSDDQSYKEKDAKVQKHFNRPVILLCSWTLMALIFIRPFHDFCITALDVGQGDAISITDGNGHSFLIDGGSTSMSQAGKYAILPYLKAEGIGKLEGVFVSHNDSDHMNGILELLKMNADGSSGVRINRLFMPVWMKEDPTGEELSDAAEAAGTKVIFLEQGTRISSGKVRFDVLFPSKKDPFTGNEGSLVIALYYKEFSALFTGDLEGEAEDLVARRIGHFDYLKASHHGSGGSTSEEFLHACTPSFCVFSAPKKSIYNHPSPETIQRVENAGAIWAHTGRDGAVAVRYQDGKIKAACYGRTCFLRGV